MDMQTFVASFKRVIKPMSIVFGVIVLLITVLILTGCLTVTFG